MGLRDLIEKAKAKREELSYKRKDQDAKRKGFSNYSSYEIQTAVARKEGYEKAKSELRKKETARAKKEEYLNTMDTRPERVKKFEKGISYLNKGMKGYNDFMGGMQGMSSNKKPDTLGGFKPSNRKQDTFASMFGMQEPRQKRRKSKPKKSKRKKKSRSTQKFNDVYSWARNY